MTPSFFQIIRSLKKLALELQCMQAVLYSDESQLSKDRHSYDSSELQSYHISSEKIYQAKISSKKVLKSTTYQIYTLYDHQKGS